MRRLATATLLAAALAASANAQTPTPADDPAALARNHEAAASVIARDSVSGVFIDISTPRAMILMQPDTRLVCPGAPDTLHLSYQPPEPYNFSARCVSNIAAPNTPPFDITIIATGMTPAAEVQRRQMNVPDVLDDATSSLARMWAEEIHAQPWTGGYVEVGGGNSPPHPPYTAQRYQGVRDGKPVYLHVAWARIGAWMYIERVEGPLENQIVIEGLAALKFYNTLLEVQAANATFAARAADATPAPAPQQP